MLATTICSTAKTVQHAKHMNRVRCLPLSRAASLFIVISIHSQKPYMSQRRDFAIATWKITVVYSPQVGHNNIHKAHQRIARRPASQLGEVAPQKPYLHDFSCKKRRHHIKSFILRLEAQRHSTTRKAMCVTLLDRQVQIVQIWKELDTLGVTAYHHAETLLLRSTLYVSIPRNRSHVSALHIIEIWRKYRAKFRGASITYTAINCATSGRAKVTQRSVLARNANSQSRVPVPR